MAMMKNMKIDETITFISDRGERIVVTIVDARPGTARLSIDAPRCFYIDYQSKNSSSYRKVDDIVSTNIQR